MPVTVRPPTAADGDAFVAAVVASRHLLRPWVDPPDDAGRYADWLDRLGRDDQAAFLVHHDGCGGLVGWVSVSNIVRRAFQSASLGYGAFAGHAGRGLMSEGVAAVVDVAFTTLGLHRLEANIQPGNGPSLALVRRLGFEREGFSPRFLRVDGDWRDHERWAVRTETWRVSADGRPAAHPEG